LLIALQGTVTTCYKVATWAEWRKSFVAILLACVC